MESTNYRELDGFEADYQPNDGESPRDAVNFSHLDVTASNSIADVEITVKQKPRGSKGVWIPLVASERIRVSDKKAGKNLRVVVASRRKDLDLDRLIIVCYEKKAASSKKKASDWTASPSSDYVELKRTTQLPTPAGFTQVVELVIKVLVMYRTVKFHVTIPSFTPSVTPLVIESAEFVTYNSGSEDVKKKKRTESKNNTSPRPENSTSLNPAEPGSTDMALSPLPYPGGSSPIDTDTSSVSPSQQQHFDPIGVDDWSVMNQNLSVDGILRAQQFLQLSDIRLKTDIRDITSAITIISQLNGRSYKWKQQSRGGGDDDAAAAVSSSASTSTTEQLDDLSRGHRCLGFIAQELERVVPEVVHRKKTGGGSRGGPGGGEVLVVAYAELVPILIEALKFHMQRQHDVEQLAHEMELTSEQLVDLQRGALTSLRAATEKIRLLPPGRPVKRPVSRKSDTSIEMSTFKSNNTKRKPIWTLDGDDHEKKQKKPPRAPPCCSGSPWKLLLIGLSLILVGSAIFLGVFFGVRPQNATLNPGPPAPTPAAPPVSFVSTNYQVGDPGFEDPAAQIWVGNQTFYEYGSQGKRSTLSRFARVDNANQFFDAGRYAVYVYQDPNVAELPQFVPVGLFQPVNIAFVLRRLRELLASRNSTNVSQTTTNAPLEPPATNTQPASPASPPVAAPMRNSVNNSSNSTTEPSTGTDNPLTATKNEPTASSGTTTSVGFTTPTIGPRETLIVNISVWMNRDYASDPSVRDATWQPHDIFIVFRIFYDSGKDTIVRQALDARVANGWRRYTMLSSLSVTPGLPAPTRVVVSFRSSLPGYVFFDAVTVDYKLIIQDG